MDFRVEWKKSTRKDLRRLPPATVDRVIAAVELPAQSPFPQGVEIQRVRLRKDVYRL